MTAVDEFVWLYHPDTGGYFRCPKPAVEAWRARGWVDTDPPEETAAPTKDPSPAVLEDVSAGLEATKAVAVEVGQPTLTPISDVAPRASKTTSNSATDPAEG